MDEDPVVTAARAGDASAFAVLAQRHRRELHVHCYRMLGSFEEAEDVVQETLLKAWDKRRTFEGGPGFRAWLYRIATNTCLDVLRSRKRHVPTGGSATDVPWLQPYPDRLLDEIPADGEGPDAVVVARETIELAFLAAVQHLPPQQRAVLLLRDVLGWSATETASVLDTTVPAANSALQRARATLREQLPERRAEWRVAEPTAQERAVLERFIAAHERYDPEVLAALVRDDVRVTMPPAPLCFEGREAMAGLYERAMGGGSDGTGMGRWRLVAVDANRQPAAASYLCAPGETEFRAFKLDVLRVEDGLVAEITTFGYALFPAFGLPAVLGPDGLG